MTAPATWAGTPAGGPVFFLGTHQPHWLARTEVPLFISHRALARRSPRRPLPRARGPWALDSGGFTELSTYGEWRTTPAAYVAAYATVPQAAAVGDDQVCPVMKTLDPTGLAATPRGQSGPSAGPSHRDVHVETPSELYAKVTYSPDARQPALE